MVFKPILRVSDRVVDEMIMALKTDGVFLQDQFDDKPNLGVSDISNPLIEIIINKSDLGNIQCLFCKEIGYDYYIANLDMLDLNEAQSKAIMLYEK